MQALQASEELAESALKCARALLLESVVDMDALIMLAQAAIHFLQRSAVAEAAADVVVEMVNYAPMERSDAAAHFWMFDGRLGSLAQLYCSNRDFSRALVTAALDLLPALNTAFKVGHGVRTIAGEIIFTLRHSFLRVVDRNKTPTGCAPLRGR